SSVAGANDSLFSWMAIFNASKPGSQNLSTAFPNGAGRGFLIPSACRGDAEERTDNCRSLGLANRCGRGQSHGLGRLYKGSRIFHRSGRQNSVAQV
ncbi:MAG: hypothetical protein ACRD4K_11785, partial [Candidatus Acidiferrales bacterium]